MMGSSRLPAAVEPIASGASETIDDTSPGRASAEVVVEPSEACFEALLQARPDTPFHMPGFVRAEDILRLRARNPARRMSANHRHNVARSRKACMEVVETLDTGALVEHEMAPLLTGSEHA
jgi:hypothetical protein